MFSHTQNLIHFQAIKKPHDQKLKHTSKNCNIDLNAHKSILSEFRYLYKPQQSVISDKPAKFWLPLKSRLTVLYTKVIITIFICLRQKLVCGVLDIFILNVENPWQNTFIPINICIDR